MAGFGGMTFREVSVADGWIPSLGFAPPEQAAAMRERVLSHERAVECV
jgi:hypothetical protein